MEITKNLDGIENYKTIFEVFYQMTPAIEQLKKSRIKFDILSYEHDVNNTNYGLEAVEKLNLNRAC